MQHPKVSIDDCLYSKDKKLAGLLKSLNALITGEYYIKANNIEIKISLKEMNTGIVISTQSILYPKDKIPPNTELQPGNIEIAKMVLTSFTKSNIVNNKFKIKIWPDKGESSIYMEKELHKLHFRTNRDCYVYLFHMDSSGNIKMIFPNDYSTKNFIEADKVYTIPDKKMNFDFEMGPPFGSEIVKAIGSLQKIDAFKLSKLKGQVFKDFGKVTDKDSGINFRGLNMIPKEERTENYCVFTTIEK